ncbi:hypothetical protein ACHAQJ_003901 [Trichoderma viride]
MEIVSNTSDEAMKGSMDVDYIYISSRSLTSFFFKVGGKLRPEFEIGWVTSITICLKYGDTTIGNVTVPNVPTMVNGQNELITDWDESKEPELEIESMRAFKSFLQDVMPKNDASGELDNQKCTTADLSVTPNGHELTMSIDLSHIARMRTTVKSIKIADTKIRITVEVTNLSPLELLFDDENLYTLKKGQQTIGKLWGELAIVPGKFQLDFHGEIQSGVTGLATLQGDFYEDLEESWQCYAIKLFEVEVNLDEADTDDHQTQLVVALSRQGR